VHIYDGQSGTKRSLLDHGAPVLDATFATESTVYSCGLDNRVQQFDVATGRKSAVVGNHDDGVRCIEWIPALGIVASASWDKTIRLWDARSSETISTLPIPDKAYSMSVTSSTSQDPLRLVIATKGRHVEVWDVRSLQEPLQKRESPLKYQTRCLRCYPNGEGYALSSVEGRVAMEYFDVSEPRKYAFKCHRRVENGNDLVYPVNAIGFNSEFGTFATGGSDGVVSIWDGQNKKRLTHITGYPTSISSLAFNHDSTLMAVASSYCYEQGDVDHPPDALFIRHVTDAELAPRLKQPPN